MSAPHSDLALAQAAFMRAVLDEGAPLPDGWGNRQALGMAVYRGNYRSAILDALASSFERTARYTGEDAFRRASIHHVLAHPPSHWTIDAVGARFDETCAEVFGDNREVAELSWLEWSMLEAAGGADTAPVTAAEFAEASAGFGDQDWGALKLQFVPRAAARVVAHDLAALWRFLEEDSDQPADLSSTSPRGCIVWREGERPTFLMVDAGSARAFTAMQNGACYAEIVGLLASDEASDEAGDAPGADAIQNAAMQAGAMLGQWLNEGLIAAFET